MADATMIEGSPRVSAQSLLSKVTEFHTLPTERIKGKPKGEIVQIAKVEDRIAALEKVEDHYELAIYDGQGNLTEMPIDPSTHDLDSVYVKVSSGEWPDAHQLIKNMGYDEATAQKAQEIWKKLANEISPGSNVVSRNQVIRFNRTFFPAGEWKMGVGEFNIEKDGKKVVQQTFYLSNGSKTHVIWFDEGKPEKKGYKPGNRDLGASDVTDSLSVSQKSTFFRIEDNNGKEVSSFAGTNAIADPSDPTRLYYINAGQVYSLDVKGVSDRSAKPVLEKDINVKNPQELRFDPNGNFLIVRAGTNVVVLDKETGEQIKDLIDVKGPIYVDRNGDIIFVDNQGGLREIQTNFQAIPKGGSESVFKKREQQLKEQQERFEKLELKKGRLKTSEVTEDSVAQTLRETISRQVSDKIANSANPEELEEVVDSLQALRGDPANKDYEAVVDEFVDQARERLSAVRTTEFNTQLGGFESALGEVKSVRDAIDLDEQFAKLLELRQKIDIRDPKQRREIEKRLDELQGKKDSISTQYQGQLVDAVNKALPDLEQLIKETGSLQELVYIGTSSQAQQFEIMLANVKDPKVRKEIRERFNQIKTEQKTKLEEKGRETAEQDRLRYAQLIEEARADLESFREQVEALGNAKEVDRFGKNPLATAWRAKILALPPELRAIEEKKLEIILGARKKDIQHRKELGAVGEAGELRFGNATFSVFKETPEIWQPKLLPYDGGLWADLVFEDVQGRVFRPAGKNEVLVNNDLDNEVTRAVVERYRKAAEEFFRGIKRKVPEFDEHWRITDFHMEKLEEIADTLNLQLANHRGITILHGEAGTGKNVLVDMLANLSNREVVTVQCNENTTKEDLAYEFDYDPKTGTVRWPSRLLEGLQKSGTIILFDELNALKPGIAKLLNSLFDYRRRLSFTAGGTPKEIVADPSVIFIGAMNPQNYAGVQRLSPEFLSRSRVIDISYPPFEEMRGGRTYWRSDEAEMLGAYMSNLGGFKQKEFKLAWDYVINKDTSNGGDAILAGDPGIESDIRRVYDVIRVANRLREMYRAYLAGDSNEPMDFPTSLRETIDIVLEMNHRQGVKPIIRRVIIPKITDPGPKKRVDQTIDAVLPS